MSTHGSVGKTPLNYDPNRPEASRPVKILDVSLRDGHQSLLATRGRTEDMIPVAERMDEVGFWAMEVWGGATFDTMHRFLNEDPWGRIRTLKRYLTKTPLSMLLRGQNLVGYRNYADDVVRAFVERSAENGIDVFRTFDALNDYRNFETVVPAIKQAGKHFQGCICYSLTEPRMGGDVYNIDYYVAKARALADMGADSICVKDMAGLIAPYDAFDLVQALKAAVDTPINLHSHFTSGMASMSHLKAVEAGVDIVDTCLAPYAYRTSHPALEPLVMTLIGTDRDTGMDISQLARIAEILENEVLPKYRDFLDESRMSIIDINVLMHQTPGGMLSNLVNQLREMGASDRLGDVFRELPKVRKELGQIPLVTPTSQIVGIQTVNNVLFDTENERYKMLTAQVKDLCFGLYGQTAIPIDQTVQRKALKGYARGEKPITCRPAEVLKPELEKSKAEIGDLAKDQDDLITYTLYPTTGRRFLSWKYARENAPDSVQPLTLKEAQDRIAASRRVLSGKPAREPNEALPQGSNVRSFRVQVDDELFQVSVDGEGISAQPLAPQARSRKPSSIAPTNAPAQEPSPPPKVPVEGTTLNAPMPGVIVAYKVQEGDTVNEGETVVILEAMKMENALGAPAGGVVKSLLKKPGDTVSQGELLCLIG